MNKRTQARLRPALAAAATVLALASTAWADQVHLNSGDLLRGVVIEHTPDRVVLAHPVLGRLEISMSEVSAITIDDAAPAAGVTEAEESAAVGESAAQDAQAAPPLPAPPATDEDEPKEWNFSVNVSGNGSWGNTDEQSVRVGFTGKRLRPDTRLALDASYYGDVSDGETSDNNYTMGVTHDWFIEGSKWFFFATGRYDFDEFESWDHRLAAHAGPGYHLIEQEDFTLDVRVGAGPRKEWGSEDDSWLFEGQLGQNLTWTISERQSFDAGTTFFWVLDDTENYRTRSELNWSLKLDPELNLSLIAGLRHEYQNIVDPGDDRNNTRGFVGLQVDF